MKKILLPTDFSDAATNAFIHALEFAKIVNAELVLLHTFEIPVYDSQFFPENYAAIYSSIELAKFEMFKDEIPKLRTIAAERKLDDIVIKHRLMDGDLIYNLKNAVEEDQIDFVIMGTTGVSDWTKFFLGSNTNSVISEVSVPVLCIPVDAKYKKEVPGTDSELNAYDVVYYAGDCNAGSKTIAVNLPNDEIIQQKKGTRRSQLKNAMKAKFDKILVPIAKELIDADQQQYINFDAFFANVMFHEVAHGLGIKKTVTGKGYVKEALQEQYSWLEEGKADVLGLYMVTGLLKKGDLEGDIKQFYTTYMAGILRSVRFGAASAHGKANMQCFNFFKEEGAFIRNANGTYKVDFVRFEAAMNKLGGVILTLQGNGDKAAVEKTQKEKAIITPELQADLNKLTKKGIPVDIVFDQGVDVLGVK